MTTDLQDYVEDFSPLLKSKKVNSRRKGNSFENKISQIFNDKFHIKEFCRTPGSGAFATTHNLPDYLKIYGDLIGPQNFRFIIECKKGYNKVFIDDLFKHGSDVWKFIKKTQRDEKNSARPAIILWQQDRKDILALINTNTCNDTRLNNLNCIVFSTYKIFLFKDLLTIEEPSFWFTS